MYILETFAWDILSCECKALYCLGVALYPGISECDFQRDTQSAGIHWFTTPTPTTAEAEARVQSRSLHGWKEAV